MRHVLSLAVFVAVLLCLPETFGPEPPVPRRFPSRDEIAEMRYPGLHKAAAFWYRPTGAERKGLSMPADARLLLVYARVVNRAHAKGLKVQPPELRQTKPELVLLLGPGIRYIFAMNYAGPRVILINSWWVERMEQWELEYVLAHELGHAIDMQNERSGHRFLNVFSDRDNDDFVADMLSLLLTHPGAYSKFVRKHPGVAGIEER